MAHLILNKTDLAVGDTGKATQLGSAMYQFQVIGNNAIVEFSGSNVPNADVTNNDHWIPLLSIASGMPDSIDYRQYVWDSIRYKVVSGTDVAVYVSIGVGS